MSAVDPITRQVIRNALKAAAAEMQAALVKTAHSPLIYETQDFGVVLTDRHGRLVAEGAALAGFLGCLPPTIQTLSWVHTFFAYRKRLVCTDVRASACSEN